MTILKSADELRALYGKPNERSVTKEIPFLNDHYKAFVKASPLVVLASAGATGLDCSPKGDKPGFVRILDDRTLAIPDRPGNNRIDNLQNLVADPRISLLFIVPGVGETLRVNGCAEISVDPELLGSFAVNGKPPRSVLIVHIETTYFHCSKALVRSQLWNPAHFVDGKQMPSAGQMLAATCEGF
jgi:PPOX class probable FMN-dependent enzyme